MSNETFVIYGGKTMVAANFSRTEDMKFGDANIITIIMYVILFIIGSATNLNSIPKLIKKRSTSRLANLFLHLTIADCLVSTC